MRPPLLLTNQNDRKMKKTLFLLLPLTVALSCKPKDYRAEMENKIKEFAAFVEACENNVDITIEQVEHRVDSAYDVFKDEIMDLAVEAVEEHSADSVSLEAILLLRQYKITDDEGLGKLLVCLTPEMKMDPRALALQEDLDKYSETAPGKPFKDFTVLQPDGKKAKLSDFAGCGKYCLVDFWASWCGPCRREVPFIREVYDEYAPKGLTVVSVAVWDNPEDSRRAAQSLGIVWNQILGADGNVTRAYMIEGIPHIMLIGPDGTILHRDLRGKEIAEAVGKYL